MKVSFIGSKFPYLSQDYKRFFGMIAAFMRIEGNISFISNQKNPNKDDTKELRKYSINLKTSYNQSEIAIYQDYNALTQYINQVKSKNPNCLNVLNLENLENLDVKKLSQVDLVLVQSDYELFLLKTQHKIDNVEFITHFYEHTKLLEYNMDNFNARKHYLFISKQDSQQIEKLIELWPKIQQDNNQLHIYSNLQIKHNQKNLKILKYQNDFKLFQNYRVYIAPVFEQNTYQHLFPEIWTQKLPIVTTLQGAKGNYIQSFQYQEEEEDGKFQILGQKQFDLNIIQNYKNNNIIGQDYFGGLCNSNCEQDFINNCRMLYNDENKWKNTLSIGIETIVQRMSFKANHTKFIKILQKYQYKKINK